MLLGEELLKAALEEAKELELRVVFGRRCLAFWIWKFDHCVGKGPDALHELVREVVEVSPLSPRPRVAQRLHATRYSWPPLFERSERIGVRPRLTLRPRVRKTVPLLQTSLA